MTDPQTAASRDKRGRFEPGASGNPAGKKPGTLNHATRLQQAFDDGDVDTAVQAVRDNLQKGNFTAARFLIDKLDPKPRSRPIPLEVPDDLPMPEKFTAVTRAMFRGEITPDEAKVMVAVLEAEDAAYQRVAAAKLAADKRLATRSTNALVMEMYRDQLEERLKIKLPPFPLDLARELCPELFDNLHSACISGDEDAETQADEPSPDSTAAPVMPGLDPGIVADADAAVAPPVTMAGSSPAMTDGVGAEADLHSACISPQDPAAVLPTPRRRAVNRVRAEAARRAAG
jgi:hypothetical protein